MGNNHYDYQAYTNKAKEQTSYSKDGVAVNNTDYGQQAMAGIFGGPLGWIEAGLGNRFLLNYLTDLTGTTPSFVEMNDEDVFNSMTPDDWTEFNHMNDGERRQFVANRKKKLLPELEKRRKAEEEAALQKQKEAEFQKWREDTMKRLDTFSKEMGMPVEELIARGDLGVKNAGATAQNMANQAAMAAGVGGRGLSLANTQRAVTDAQAKYQLQRAQLGSQATQGLLGAMSGMSMEQEARRQYEQNMNLQLQQAQAAAQQQQYLQGQQRSGQMLGMIGGVVGGVYGGPTGAAAGYQLGSGLGQASYGQGNQYKPYNYSYPSGTSQAGSGGLSNTRYGGAQ